jgi:hypothetical protein
VTTFVSARENEGLAKKRKNNKSDRRYRVSMLFEIKFLDYFGSMIFEECVSIKGKKKNSKETFGGNLGPKNMDSGRRNERKPSEVLPLRTYFSSPLISLFLLL